MKATRLYTRAWLNRIKNLDQQDKIHDLSKIEVETYNTSTSFIGGTSYSISDKQTKKDESSELEKSVLNPEDILKE